METNKKATHKKIKEEKLSISLLKKHLIKIKVVQNKAFFFFTTVCIFFNSLCVQEKLQQSLLLWANGRLRDIYTLKIVTVRPLAVTGTLF